jgi:hypothetical protein
MKQSEIIETFVEARRVLGVDAAADFGEIKRAYRRLTLSHPPDSDPEAFQRIRAAYELLEDPIPRATELLGEERPLVPPPELLEVDMPERGALALRMLRVAVLSLDGKVLLGGGTE